MKVYLVTFAYGEIYEKSQQNLNQTLSISNINEHIMWNKDKIKATQFYQENKELLDIEMGCGYWAWKPYIILEKLKDISDEDYIIYMDASRYETDGFKNSCLGVIEHMQRNSIDLIPGFQTNDQNWKMIKPSCLNYFNLNNEEFKNQPNVFTSPMFLKKSEFTVNFIKEWMKECKIENNISHQDLSNIGGKIHIYDQAILNCLLYKYKISSYQPNTKDENEFRKYSYYFRYFHDLINI